VNYERHIASYISDGLKIYGLFTIPNDSKPKKESAPPTDGFPAIIFIHGYLDPETYQTTERYVAYQDGFARNGFVTFKPDLRGHGKSEGEPVTSAFSDGYIADTLNLLSALKADKKIDPKRIGIWGHSMGGGISLRSMVVSKEIKAGVIWAGVVGDYQDLLQRYQKRATWLTRQASSSQARQFYEKYGSPSANPKFWNEIDPYAFLNDISGPIQLNHGTLDESVPLEFSQHLHDSLKKAGKTVEYFEYPSSDHNIAQGFNLAMQRSVEFFKKHL
jgi:dipeptidyl aminopeptidase/acylaminoacyl peptidase